MECNVLINFLSEYNDQNIISNLMLKPKKSIFIHDNKEETKEMFAEVKEFINRKIDNIEIEGRVIENDDYASITNIINEFKNDKLVINLSGGNRLLAFAAYQIACQNNIVSVLVDMETKSIFRLNNNSILNLDEKFIELSVEDIIESTGGEIIYETTTLMENKEMDKLIDYIVNNYEDWNSIKTIFLDRKLVKTFEKSPRTIQIMWKRLDVSTKTEVMMLINKLQELRLIRVIYNEKHSIKFSFKTRKLKKFFLSVGSWLEILTYKIIKEIKGTDDIRSGVLFLWDDGIKDIKNEIDVMASVDSSLVCVSCKDSKNYRESDLNELEVYAEKIGGEDVLKLLVATGLPKKRSVLKRAEEMDIHLIVFDGDIDTFKRDIERVIMNKVTYSI